MARSPASRRPRPLPPSQSPTPSSRPERIDASVLLDDKIKADPALAADCLAEGRKWMDKHAADASNEKDPILFRDGAWTFERKYSVRSVVDGHYVSVVRSDYMNTGGAHPNSDVNTILWDQTAKKRISIRPFFTETADDGPTMTAMRKAVIAALNIEKKKRDSSATATAEWYKSVEPGAAQDRRGDAGAIDRAGQECGPDLSLSALCGRTLCRRRIRRVRAVGKPESLSVGGRNEDLWWRAAQGRR